MAGAAVRNNTQLKKKAARTRVKREAATANQHRIASAQHKRKVIKARKPAAKKASKGFGFQFRLFILFLLTIGICQVGFYCYSQNGPLFVEALKFPGRLMTAGINGSVGAITEGFNGIIETEQQFAGETFAHAKSDPLMIPVGIVSATVAIPVGFLSKAPKGMITYGQEGYAWWDEWFPTKQR